ncbi:MAG: phosphoserine transaminase [Microscillaceae bacterium]
MQILSPLHFYPGPSKLYPQIGEYLQTALAQGFFSFNHRSPEFVKCVRETVHHLKAKLEIPDDYQVFFVSSATECWEIIAQSLVQYRSLHVFNGAFGEKWWKNTRRLKAAPELIQGFTFAPEACPELPILKAKMPPHTELIALTHNETSNGTALPTDFLWELRQAFPEVLLALDATSSMAGMALPWAAGDLWLASVQKCFGLPAGLALLLASPQALARAEAIGENRHYNSLLALAAQAQVFQTTHTPNMLGIYLLGQVMQAVAPIAQVDSLLRQRAREGYAFFEKLDFVQPLIQNPEVRSDTVLALRTHEELLAKIKAAARNKNIILGNGYGNWKNTTFRVANFPAITNTEFELLQDFMVNFKK